MGRFTLLIACFVSLLPLTAGEMTKLTIQVTNTRSKPVDNALVVVKFIQGHDLTKLGRGIRREWELRTNQDGSVTIPSIPQGKITIQVIAKNYQTFGESFDVDEVEKTIPVHLNPPQPQYSAH